MKELGTDDWSDRKKGEVKADASFWLGQLVDDDIILQDRENQKETNLTESFYIELHTYYCEWIGLYFCRSDKT